MRGHCLNLTVVAPTWQNSRCMCHSSTGTKMAFSLLLKLSKVWSHFSAAHDLTCYFLEFICSIHRMELSSFFHQFLYLRRHTGFVAIGCEIAFSTAAASTIHTALAPFTNPVCTLALLYPVSKLLSKLAMVHSYRWLFSTSTQCSLVHCHLTSISTWSISTKQFTVATPVPTILKEGRENEKYIPCIQTYH